MNDDVTEIDTIQACRERGKTFASPAFAREVGEILQRSPSEVSLHLDALLQARRLPITATKSQAKWAASTEAARILAAIGSRQVNPGSIVRVSDRILAMQYQCDVAIPGRNPTGASAVKALSSFEAGLAAAVSEVWDASQRAKGISISPNITMTWNESGTLLYGTMDDTKRGVRALYSTAKISPPPGMMIGMWDFVQTDQVGGSIFSALSILGFAELIRDALGAKVIGGYGANVG